MEEESYVLIELSGVVEEDWKRLIPERCKFVGLESKNPYLQIGPYIFQGKFQDTVGTSVVFEDNEEGKLKHICSTHKKLIMQRIFLKEKPNVSNQASNEVIEDESITEVMDIENSGESSSKDKQ